MGESSGTAGSDAERRFALELARDLRDGGRDARVQTFWFRGAWWLTLAACAAGGIVASVLSVGNPLPGLVVAARAAVLAAAELTGFPVLRRLTRARASQNVVSPPPSRPGERPVTLILTAATDRPRRGLATRLRLPLPVLTIAALVLIGACAGLRVAGIDDGWVGAAQVVPTLVALVALVTFLDQGVADVAERPPAAAAVLELARVLDAEPPRHLDVAVVLAGAGAAQAAGLRRWLDGRRRRGMLAAQVAIVHLEPTGEPLWWERDGIALPSALHPQLRDCAREAAAGDPPAARPVRRMQGTAAAWARADRWPVIAVGVSDDDVQFVRTLVRNLDERLGASSS